MSQILHPHQMNRAARRRAQAVARKPKEAASAVASLGSDMVEFGPEIETAGLVATAAPSGTLSPAQAVKAVHPQIRGMILRLLRDHGATPEMVREALHPGWLNFGVRVAGIEKRADVIFDHVIPPCRGGPHTPENAECICARCNNVKGGRTLQEMGYEVTRIAADAVALILRSKHSPGYDAEREVRLDSSPVGIAARQAAEDSIEEARRNGWRPPEPKVRRPRRSRIIG